MRELRQLESLFGNKKQLQRELKSIVEDLNVEGREGFIVSHNEPRAVLMSLKRYEELRVLEEARFKEEEEVLEIVAKGEKEFAEGKTRSSKSLKSLL